MPNANAPGTTGGSRTEDSTPSGDSTSPSVSVEKPTTSAVEYIIEAVEANGGVAEIPVFDSDAESVGELAEADLDDPWDSILSGMANSVDSISLESIFGVDLSGQEVEYVGTPPLLNEKNKSEFSDLDEETQDRYPDDEKYSYGDPENGLKSYITAPDWLDVETEGRIKKSVVSDATEVLNAYHYPEIYDRFHNGSDVRLVVGVGRKSNHVDENGDVDEFSKRRHVSFSTERGSSSLKRVVNQAERQGMIDEDDKEAWQDGELDGEDIAELIRQNREE